MDNQPKLGRPRKQNNTSKGSKKSKSSKPAFRSKKWAKRGTASKANKTLPLVGDEFHLSDYGYTLHNSDKERKSSLKKASKGEKSALPVLKRVNLIRNYTKSVPENYFKLSKDVEFLKQEYKKEKKSKNSK
jgi:hypothetical protein